MEMWTGSEEGGSVLDRSIDNGRRVLTKYPRRLPVTNSQTGAFSRNMSTVSSSAIGG